MKKKRYIGIIFSAHSLCTYGDFTKYFFMCYKLFCQYCLIIWTVRFLIPHLPRGLVWRTLHRHYIKLTMLTGQQSASGVWSIISPWSRGNMYVNITYSSVKADWKDTIIIHESHPSPRFLQHMCSSHPYYVTSTPHQCIVHSMLTLKSIDRGTWRIGRAPDCHTSHAGVQGSSPTDHTGVFLYPSDLINVVTTGTTWVSVSCFLGHSAYLDITPLYLV